jgi:hypothetical protein
LDEAMYALDALRSIEDVRRKASGLLSSGNHEDGRVASIPNPQAERSFAMDDVVGRRTLWTASGRNIGKNSPGERRRRPIPTD